MGAVETMDDFFERLNAGDRDGAVGLFDDRTEMRVHVARQRPDAARLEQVERLVPARRRGFPMIPGQVRETGNTYEADLLVVRPGAASQHLDATFRVEAGKITAINLTPR